MCKSYGFNFRFLVNVEHSIINLVVFIIFFVLYVIIIVNRIFTIWIYLKIDDAILEFTNALLEQMKIVSFKYKK